MSHHAIPVSRLSALGLWILTLLFLLALALRAQDANCPTCASSIPSTVTRAVTNGTAQKRIKATGVTIHKCKIVAVYMSVEHGRILSPMWADKAMTMTVSNPMFCDAQGRVTFYVLPSQDYEIEMMEPGGAR